MRAMKWTPMLLVAMALSLAVNLYLALSRNSAPKQPERFWLQKYATRAIDRKAREEHSSAEVLARLTVPIIIEFRDDVCVELAPAWGVTGGRSITCFQSATGKISMVDDIGQ